MVVQGSEWTVVVGQVESPLGKAARKDKEQPGTPWWQKEAAGSKQEPWVMGRGAAVR